MSEKESEATKTNLSKVETPIFVPKEEIVETNHTIQINGQEIAYTVTTGTLILKEESQKDDKSEGEKAKATIFFTAYTRNSDIDVSQRPITFCFNGGPGSSSVWLHLGLFGPRRVQLDDIGNALPPPYRLVDNAYSLLDLTDLVFIDPVSTGFSRAVPGENPKDFHGFKKDLESVGDFIRLYTTRYERWSSPKFLAGESYGTTRAVAVSGYLQERHGLFLNGLMLISVVLDFQTLSHDPGNDLPYILFLPTFTATAWYHQRLARRLKNNFQKALAESKTFAMEEYALGLMKGAALPSKERTRLVQRLAYYTGLSTEFIQRHNLRVNMSRFVRELMREQKRVVGRLDSRFLGIDNDLGGSDFSYDPSYSNILGPYTATLNDYVRRELGFKSDLPYEILTDHVHPWSYGEHENRYLNVGPTLRNVMTENPHLKVFVANGLYDMATPYLATEYTFSHLGLDESLQGNIFMGHYEAGHMMYIHKASLTSLRADLVRFLETAVPKN